MLPPRPRGEQRSSRRSRPRRGAGPTGPPEAIACPSYTADPRRGSRHGCRRPEPEPPLRSASAHAVRDLLRASAPPALGRGDEQRLYRDALEQVALADRVGFDSVWEVEHHFLEEYSHSSASDVFLAAASQRTERIRLGFGILHLPPGYQHPARVAETAATLDLVSGGRVELGTGETSSGAELGGFGVHRDTKREQWDEALDVVTRMMVEEPFAGYDGRFLKMPPRNVVPKPVQKPHPPLWVACSRRETILLAARKGMGALSFSFVEPEEAGQWVAEYEEILTSEECVPGGFAVNPNVAVVLPMMLHPDEATAIERGIDGAHFFGYSLAHYYVFGDHRPGRTSIWEEFQERRAEVGFSREIIEADAEPAGREDPPAGPGFPAGRHRDPRPGARPRHPLRARGRGSGHLRAPGRAQPPRAHLRVPRALRRRGHAGVRRPRRRGRGGQARAPGARGRGGARPARARARGRPRLRHRPGRLGPRARPDRRERAGGERAPRRRRVRDRRAGSRRAGRPRSPPSCATATTAGWSARWAPAWGCA